MARKPRVRDYKAEYARRKQREQERAKAEKRAFDLKRARGHGNTRLKSKIKRLADTRAPWEPEVDEEELYEIGETEGWDVLEQALDEQHEMFELWLNNDYEGARQVWLHRNSDLPDWLYHYHGWFN